MVVPFFSNASYGTTGFSGANWEDIRNDIVNLARSEALRRSDRQTVGMQQVVLFNFSCGRAFTYNFLANSKGVD